MMIKVTYMSGAGNIFAVIDGRNYDLSEKQYSKLSPFLCDSFEAGSSAEGLLVLLSDDDLDFRVLYFNPDGSSGMMCGNGGRCAVRFAISSGIISSEIVSAEKKSKEKDIRFFMSGDSYLSYINEGRISLEMPPPKEFTANFDIGSFLIDDVRISNLDINSDDSVISGAYVNVGSDHFVINVNDLDIGSIQDINIDKISPPIRNHKAFGPRGVNVNYYDIIEADKIILRTYERGVEAETGACGTGAIATALTAFVKDCIFLPVTIIPPSGLPLVVDIIGNSVGDSIDDSIVNEAGNVIDSITNDAVNNIEKFILTGSADILFEKDIIVPDDFI